MLIDIPSAVNAALGARAWWASWAEFVAWVVAGSVALEEFVDFKFVKRRIGVSCSRTLAKIGWFVLVAALIAEVPIGMHITANTDIIEKNLTTKVRDAVAANDKLGKRLQTEETNLTIAAGKISDLTNKEKSLRDALNQDGDALRLQSEYLVGRRITRHQYEAIRELKGKIPRLFILTEKHCMECRSFTDQLAEVFSQAAGAQVSMTFVDSLMTDGCLYETSPYVETLYGAFKKGNFKFFKCPGVPSFVHTDGMFPIISVGERLPFSPKPQLSPWLPGGAWHIKPEKRQ